MKISRMSGASISGTTRPRSAKVLNERAAARASRTSGQGAIPKAGNPHARRVLVKGAWASHYRAKGSRHVPLRLAKPPTVIQASSWKAPVRLCKRSRRLVARGKPATGVPVAIARERPGFMGAIAQEGPSAV